MTLLERVLDEVGEGLVVDEHPDLLGSASAVFDPDGFYRYALFRHWGPGPIALLVMLNPSTATATDDDQTIRRCVAFARREGCGSLGVVNLFALRSTDPKRLAEHAEPIGPHNDQVLAAVARLAARLPGSRVIVAWGAGGQLLDRDQRVAATLTSAGLDLLCLGVTAEGFPRHPSRLANSTPLRLYRAAPAEFRVLSVRRPWANLLFRGKNIENRSWSTRWRGRVVLHAGQRWEPRGREVAAALGIEVARDEPEGYLGVAELVDVHPDAGCCRPWGEPGAFHWQFAESLLFSAPIAGPGRLGLYRAVPSAVRSVLGAAA
ncbi:hypothetical protein GCM10027258_79530 [Amycolatopsis stemonae]